MKTLDKFLIADFILLILFTIVNLIIFCVKGCIPDTLVTSFFMCFGAENGFMALIIIAKKIVEKKGNDDYDE